jgi:hypothetical protein
VSHNHFLGAPIPRSPNGAPAAVPALFPPPTLGRPVFTSLGARPRAVLERRLLFVLERLRAEGARGGHRLNAITEAELFRAAGIEP